MPTQQASSLNNIVNLLGLFKPPGSGTITDTTKESVPPEAINAIVQQILQGTNGLAQVSSGQKAAGMYNSTSNQLLTNDLIARTAAEAAKSNKTTTSTKTSQPQGQLDFGKTAGSIALAQLFGPTIKKASQVTGINNIGDTLANTLFPDSTPAVDTSVLDKFDLGSTFSGNTAADVGQNLISGALGDSSLSDAALASLNSGDATTGLVSSILGGSGVAGTSALMTDSAVAASGDALASAAIDSAATDVGAGLATDAAIGAGVDAAATDVAAGAVTDAAAGVAADAGFGDMLASIGAALAWIICTELHTQKRMPTKWYIKGAPVFTAYPDSVKRGYYFWAIPSVAHLRNYPQSLYSKFLEVIFNWRAENIAAHSGVKNARKLIRGAAVTAVLYPICWVLGHTVARKPLNWAKVYTPEFGGK